MTVSNEGTSADIVYMDFNKAYDIVSHGILIHKIKRHRFSLGAPGSSHILKTCEFVY